MYTGYITFIRECFQLVRNILIEFGGDPVRGRKGQIRVVSRNRVFGSCGPTVIVIKRERRINLLHDKTHTRAKFFDDRSTAF